jgi:hypothetical protein
LSGIRLAGTAAEPFTGSASAASAARGLSSEIRRALRAMMISDDFASWRWTFVADAG